MTAWQRLGFVVVALGILGWWLGDNATALFGDLWLLGWVAALLIVIIGNIAGATAGQIGTIFETIGAILWSPFRAVGAVVRAVARSTGPVARGIGSMAVVAWGIGTASPKNLFWGIVGLLVTTELLTLAGLSIGEIGLYAGEWVGLLDPAVRTTSTPYPAVATGALILFAVGAGLKAWEKRPAKIVTVVLASIYFASVVWPLYGPAISNAVPKPVRELVRAQARETTAKVQRRANRKAVDAGQAEFQADAARTAQLGRLSADSLCFENDGKPVLEAGGTNPVVLKTGEAGRIFVNTAQPPAVYNAIDQQRAILMSFPVKQKDRPEMWLAGESRYCWVDAGHVDRAEERKVLGTATAQPGAETPVAKVVEVHRDDLVITPGGCLPLEGPAFDIRNRRVKFYPSDDRTPRTYELGDLKDGRFTARHSITAPKEKLPAVLPAPYLRICFPEGLHGGHLEIGWNR